MAAGRAVRRSQRGELEFSPFSIFERLQWIERQRDVDVISGRHGLWRHESAGKLGAGT